MNDRITEPVKMVADGSIRAERLAAFGVATPPSILGGLTLTEVDLILRIVLTCVGIAVGVATFIYYRKKTPK